jgi:hypothetical protein
MSDDGRIYKIVRYYEPKTLRKDRTIMTRLTLKEAQEHCSDPRHRKRGQYLDGYEYMRGHEPKDRPF